MRAVVLSGGGAKGAYEIGVWKALRKLHVTYDIVTGTSSGALNAAFMVQKDYLRAMLLWYNLNSKMVYDSNIDIKSNKDFIKHAKKIFIDGGITVGNLEKTVKKYVNVKKIYKSPIDLGLVTVKLPTFEPVELTKEEIPMDKFTDYLIASATFPVFQKKEIDDTKYVDGGFYDNLPINLAISMGATEVVAVDLEAIGLKKQVKNKNVPVTIISPKSDIGSILVFDKELSRKAISLGYNDAMKVYNKLDGDILTFKKGSLEKNYYKYKNKYIEYFNLFLDIKDQGLLTKIIHLSVYEKLFEKSDQEDFVSKFNEIVEKTGLMLGIDESTIYTISKYHKALFQKINEISKQSFDEIHSKRNSAKIKRLFREDLMVAYLYHNLNENITMDDISNLVLIFPNAFLSALYLYVIKET